MSVLHAIGNTSFVRLRKVVPPGGGEIHVKLEWENPTGSMKDRMALAVISEAEADGRLRPGDTVVEYTGGSTGASLALVCAVIRPVMSAFPERVAGSACAMSISRLAQRSLALRPAHSRCHQFVARLPEGFRQFVTSMPAPAAAGWSGVSV